MNKKLHPYLQKLELQMQEHEIGPVEVHTSFGQEYACIPRSQWIEVCNRALNNELRAARLQEQVDCRDVVSAAKDADLDAIEERLTQIRRRMGRLRAWCVVWAMGFGSAFIGLVVAVRLLWRVM